MNTRIDLPLSKVTRVVIHDQLHGEYVIDGEDDNGNYTSAEWRNDTEEHSDDDLITEAEAIERAVQFIADWGLPPWLPIYIQHHPWTSYTIIRPASAR